MKPKELAKTLRENPDIKLERIEEELIECQKCHWRGHHDDLIAPTSSDEPGCPNCLSTDFLEVEEMKTIREKYNLTIKPAILPAERHKLQDALKEIGYKVTGGGTHTDMSECDISFEKSITNS